MNFTYNSDLLFQNNALIIDDTETIEKFRIDERINSDEIAQAINSLPVPDHIRIPEPPDDITIAKTS